MISKDQAIQNIREYILVLKDDEKIDKCKDILTSDDPLEGISFDVEDDDEE